jgi:hypothetical protein
MPTLSVVAASAKSVSEVLDALTDFPLEMTRVRTDDRGVSVQFEVSEDELAPVLIAIDELQVRAGPESTRLSLDGHSYFLYSDPLA